MNNKMSFIGAGNMAYAIILGYIKSSAAENVAADVGIYDINENRKKIFLDMGCRILKDSREAAEFAKYIVLCVKPQNIDDALENIAGYITEDHVIISIVTGVSAEYMQNKIGKKCKIVRVMPNTPLLIGSGATALSDTGNLEEQELVFAESLFKNSGVAERIPAEYMNEIIPVNGSSPAYIYLFAKIFIDKAEEAGIDRTAAKELFCQTLIGSAKMMLESGKSEDELIKMVCSPGGTTLSGLEKLKENGFEDTVKKCIDACVKRAYEIGK